MGANKPVSFILGCHFRVTNGHGFLQLSLDFLVLHSKKMTKDPTQCPDFAVGETSQVS